MNQYKKTFSPFRSAIARRLIVYVLLFSSGITLISTAIQMAMDYRYDVDLIEKEFRAIAIRDLDSIAQALWTLDETQISVQLDGLFTNPDIVYAAIRSEGRVVYVRGVESADYERSREYRISYTNQDRTHEIGTLIVSASFAGIYRRLLNKVAVILISNFIKTFLVSLFILVLFHRMVARHLVALAEYAGSLSGNLNQPPFLLDQKTSGPEEDNEIRTVVNAINGLRENLYRLTEELEEEIKLHLAELLDERNFIATLLDTQEALVIVLDHEGKVIRFNSGCEKLTGYTREEMLGTVFWTTLVPEAEQAKVATAFQNLKAEDFPNQFENRWKNKSGEIRHLAWHNNIIAASDGSVAYVVGTGLDLTDRKALENKVLVQEKLATLGQLTGTVSHELRNPLSTVQASLEITKSLVKGQDNPRLHRTLDRMERNVLRCNTIIDELLDYSRASRLDRKPVDMGDFLRRFLGEYAAPQGVRIKGDVSLNGPPLEVDAERLRRVMINLMDNAVQAMQDYQPEEGEYQPLLEVNALRVEGACRIQVRDNGPGIPPETLANIFQPLFSTKNYGVGLGLPIARAIMENHGGALSVESTPGAGTTFTMTLPTTPPPKKQPAQ